jgi:multidrug resistance efflux pump
MYPRENALGKEENVHQNDNIAVENLPATGTVDSISPASASSFSLLPAENTSGNWVKVVQRIPMRVSVANAPGKPQLRVGMTNSRRPRDSP